MAAYIKRLFGNTKIVVHILVGVFAISSWVNINGMWSELPLLVEKAKEGWTLPSYITIISQVANIGPVLFVLLSYLAPQTKPRLEKVTSLLIILLGMVACFVLAFLWEHSSFIGGSEHSTALLVLNFFFAIGDCTSSVSFFAFMSHLKPEYMASLFIGEGFSALVPAVLALGQGAGDIMCNGTQATSVEPNFSIKVYFIILSGVMAVSAIAFLLLNLWGYCTSELLQAPNNSGRIKEPGQGQMSSYDVLQNRDSGSDDEGDPLSPQNSDSNGHAGPYNSISDADEGQIRSYELPLALSRLKSNIVEISNGNEHTKSMNQKIRSFIQIDEIPLWHFFIFMSLILLINLTLTSFLSSIQIYSVLPYGLEYYHLAITLAQIANPVACVFALFVRTSSPAVILALTLVGEASVTYIIYIATQSPTPLLDGTRQGGILAVAIWVLTTLMLTYAKVSIAGVMRKYGRSALIWVGVSTQLGSLVGAVIAFVLVNVYKLFTDAPYCE